jgi:hypothetical protein
MWSRNNDVPGWILLEHSIYPSPSEPATSPLCSPYYRYSSEPFASFCILSFLVIATSIDQTFYPATHYLAAVWLDSRHGPNTFAINMNIKSNLHTFGKFLISCIISNHIAQHFF